MTKIEQRQLVHAPLASAQRFLDGFFAAHREADAEAAQVTLHVGDMIARDALITFTPAHRPEDMTPRFTVDWKDASGGPFPQFHGTLTVAGDEDYESFWLVLDGEYSPPGGIGGQVFDAVFGKRIADATASGFLAEIRDQSETRFVAEEEHKAHAG
jgi:hypothetical protein